MTSFDPQSASQTRAGVWEPSLDQHARLDAEMIGQTPWDPAAGRTGAGQGTDAAQGAAGLTARRGPEIAPAGRRKAGMARKNRRRAQKRATADRAWHPSGRPVAGNLRQSGGFPFDVYEVS